MELVKQLQEDLQERKEVWWEWHKANPEVWLKFEEYTLEAIKSGRKKLLALGDYQQDSLA